MSAPTTNSDASPNVMSIVRAVRPRQAVKNLLVAAAPLAAGEIANPRVAMATLGGILAFWFMSMAVYLVNDVLDAEADRRHPRKRHRPVASGELAVPAAVTIAVTLALAAIIVAGTVNVALAALLIAYLLLQIAYSLWLKHQVVIDVAVVASGFLLRAIAGGVATGLPLSQWFLLVAGFGSLYVVAGKRLAEHMTGVEASKSSSMYSESYLRLLLGVAAGMTIAAYSLWAFEVPSAGLLPWHAFSIAPFVVAILRYAIDVDQGRAGEPEAIVWSDRGLQMVGLIWLCLFVLGAYSA